MRARSLSHAVMQYSSHNKKTFVPNVSKLTYILKPNLKLYIETMDVYTTLNTCT